MKGEENKKKNTDDKRNKNNKINKYIGENGVASI